MSLTSPSPSTSKGPRQQHDELLRMIQTLHQNTQQLDENLRALQDDNNNLLQVNRELMKENKELHKQIEKLENSGCCGIFRSMFPCLRRSNNDSILNDSNNSEE